MVPCQSSMASMSKVALRPRPAFVIVGVALMAGYLGLLCAPLRALASSSSSSDCP
ncbi:hypothetical protein [Streptomyces sp. NPDC002785]|uniref:hypothetical protein n=1 Tax=Streptomyces sp. NPDC002785 TaxID=3154543 RepID=UPI0033272276